MSVLLPGIQPLALVRVPEPFDPPDWIYEIKYDGFRALAYVQDGDARLVSSRGNVFKSFQDLAAWIGANLAAESVILDAGPAPGRRLRDPAERLLLSPAPN